MALCDEVMQQHVVGPLAELGVNLADIPRALERATTIVRKQWTSTR
jgi:hypothetical protein